MNLVECYKVELITKKGELVAEIKLMRGHLFWDSKHRVLYFKEYGENLRLLWGSEIEDFQMTKNEAEVALTQILADAAHYNIEIKRSN